MKKSPLIYVFSLSCFLAAGASIIWFSQESPLAEVAAQNNMSKSEFKSINEMRNVIADKIGPDLNRGQWPQEISIPGALGEQSGHIQYTIDNELQAAAGKILETYKPDYGAVVIMNAESGKILALQSFQKNQTIDMNLAFRGTFPAASIFKIITAAAALDKYPDVTPETEVSFNGGNHTLYKKNVMSNAVTKWTRSMSLREAFARSINTVFGRLTLERLNPQDLEEYAIKFGFNQNIKTDLPFDPGYTEIPKEKNFHLTELASGYNRVTTMSPIQGAMIAASIASDGKMPVPYVVEKIQSNDGRTLFQAEPLTAGQSMTVSGAQKIQELMEATITQGTSRKSFRTLVKDKKFKELILGGKTGSLTGEDPKGKVDWFVGYAKNENQKIAIAALTVNVQKWTIKSSQMAQMLFRTHFKDQFSKTNEKFFSDSRNYENSTPFEFDKKDSQDPNPSTTNNSQTSELHLQKTNSISHDILGLPKNQKNLNELPVDQKLSNLKNLDAVLFLDLLNHEISLNL